jgi:hypothetical protein
MMVISTSKKPAKPSPATVSSSKKKAAIQPKPTDGASVGTNPASSRCISVEEEEEPKGNVEGIDLSDNESVVEVNEETELSKYG